MSETHSPRVELVWPGKYEEAGHLRAPSATAVPLRVCERLPGSPLPGSGQETPSPASERESPHTGGDGWRNRLIRGDNLAVMASLLPEFAGKIDLIYLDPPFNTGGDFTLSHALGDESEGSPMARVVEERAYSDRWQDGLESYLPMLYDRLRVAHQLLAETGSLYLHVDPTAGHYLRPLLDEVFGPESFQREIIWRIGWVSGYKSAARNWIRNHDTLLFYVKTPGRFTFNKEYVPYPPGYQRRKGPKARGQGYPIDDVWNANLFEFALKGEESLDSIQIRSFSREKSGFPTQKNESLLRRIVRASSNPGDLVADFFCGSGTTAVAAEGLGRHWIACDLSPRAIHVARKRLLTLEHCRPFDIFDLGEGQEQPHAADAPRAEVRVAFPEGRTAVVSLTSYAYPDPALLPEKTRGKLAAWSDLVDYWAVDWDYRGEVFAPAWASCRTRARRTLCLTSDAHPYQAPGTYRVAVHVVDILGRETREVMALEVR